jgi:hypothetical protein
MEERAGIAIGSRSARLASMRHVSINPEIVFWLLVSMI